jgi:trigger factor
MTAHASDADAIQVRSEEESPILHRLEVEVGAARVRSAFDRAYRDLARRVPVRGFRPGKVPRPVLERLYGPSVTEQLEQTLVAETLGDAIEKAGLEPVSEPAIEAGQIEAGAAFHYTARVEVKPAISLPDLAGLPARRPRVEVAEEEVERELEALRLRRAPLIEEPEGTVLARGHVAVLDFVGRVDGRPFEGGSGQGVEVELGSGQLLAGFEEQLEGARAGDDREVRVRFPEDYGNPELAGREAVFAVHVAAVKRRELPALDDEFAVDLGEFENLGQVRQRIRDDLRSARERGARAVLHRTLLEALIERTRFDVPPGLVERRLEQELHSAHERLEGQVSHDALHEQLERWREEWRERAERQVRESLLLEAVARAHQLAVAPEELEARVAEMAKRQGVTPARLRKALGGEAFERVLEAQMIDDKALEFLAAQAKVEETSDT